MGSRFLKNERMGKHIRAMKKEPFIYVMETDLHWSQCSVVKMMSGQAYFKQ